MDRLKLGIIFGGCSEEHPVSVKSAQQVAKYLDTEALLSELESGRLGGAALDVLEGEEGIFYADCRNKPIESQPLLRLQERPNVIVSPHTAYYTDHALSDMVENSIINCLEFERRNHHG